MGKASRHIKNCIHLANEMASIMIEQGDMLISHNTMYLFTNILINDTLDIIKKQLGDDTELKIRTETITSLTGREQRR